MSRLEFAAALIVVAAVSVASFHRNLTWLDGISLWADAAAKSPHEARPNNNIGDALMKAGRYDEAISALGSAVKADPWYVEPHYNLGVSYIKKRRFDEAAAELTEVVRINAFLKTGHAGVRVIPRYELGAHSNLGNIYSLKGMFVESVAHYREALVVSPLDVSTRFNLAVTLMRAGQRHEAAVEFEEVLRIDPSDQEARRYLKALKGENGG
ncbi:MAG: tetratricopeptide repeat protein [Deltaproteobacteria bacterium]|nr:tetratricopeptide repeat protein [Deltaproteobacteria bacterium]